MFFKGVQEKIKYCLLEVVEKNCHVGSKAGVQAGVSASEICAIKK